jgi:hypothetical protein
MGVAISVPSNFILKGMVNPKISKIPRGAISELYRCLYLPGAEKLDSHL